MCSNARKVLVDLPILENSRSGVIATGGALAEAAKERASIRGQLSSGRSWKGYAIAVAATVLATLFRWALGRAFVDLPPFITLVPMVALVAMLAGGRAGVLATILSALADDYLFFSPTHPLAGAGPTHAVGLGLYITAGLLVSLMAELLNRARRREAASERELLLRAMSEGIPDPLFLKDRDSRIVLANLATVRAVGKPAEQIVGHTDDEFFDDPAVGRAMKANDRRVMESGRAEATEELIPSPEGVRTFLSIKTPWRDAEGRIIGIIGCARDITERKRMEEALRQSEARLRAFFEQAAVGTAVADPATGRFTHANSRYCEITGYELPELLGMTFTDVTHPGDRVADRECYDRLARGETREFLVEKRYVRKDGRVIWVQVAVGMVRDAQGRAVQSVGVIQDITERKRWEEALRRSEAGLTAAQRLAHIGSWEWNVENDTAIWSDETFRIFGVAGGQLEQHRRQLAEMIHPEDRERVDQALTDALSGAKEYDLDYRVRRPDGSERTIHTQAEVLRGGDGEPVMMRGTVRDITERKRWEDQLKELNATLEQRVAERTAEAEHRAAQLRALAAQLTQAEQKERQRLATILHDHLQQLLASTKFHLGGFRRWLQDPQQRESLRQVDNLLDESLATSRGLTVDLSPPILQQGDMRQVLEWLAQWFRDKHGLTVAVQTEEGANPQSREVRALLFEAVRELLFNVVKHGKVSQARVELGRASGGRVKVVVHDAGAGFDPSVVQGAGRESTGFGLFRIRERLDWLGGQMEVQSAVGQGTRVTLLAPMRLQTQTVEGSEALEIASAAGRQVPADEDRGASGKVHVLLADDHEVMRTGLAELLQQEPWIEVVGQASDGREAVELAVQLQPDVVLMDVSMPHMDGVEATRQIVAQQPWVKVIGLSMFEEAGVVEAMQAAGAASYLAKTSGPDALVAAIRAYSRIATRMSDGESHSFHPDFPR